MNSYCSTNDRTAPNVYGQFTGRLYSGILFLSILFFAFLLSSCGSSKSDGVGNSYLARIGVAATDLDRNIAALKPEFVVEFQEKGGLYLGMAAGGAGASSSQQIKTIGDIQSVSFIVFDEKGRLLDSMYTDVITRSGLAEPESASLVISAGVAWRPKPPAPQEFHLIMLVRSHSSVWIRETVTSFDLPLYTESILLDLKHTQKGKGLEFILSAERVAEPSGEEYLPSSEAFRITLFNGPTRLWSSSEGMAFTQAIGPVEPQELGGKVEYRVLWNGTDTNGQQAKRGALTVEALIPAKPAPYVLRKEIQWNAQ